MSIMSNKWQVKLFTKVFNHLSILSKKMKKIYTLGSGIIMF